MLTFLSILKAIKVVNTNAVFIHFRFSNLNIFTNCLNNRKRGVEFDNF